jgi:hypothetical protein
MRKASRRFVGRLELDLSCPDSFEKFCTFPSSAVVELASQTPTNGEDGT